MMEYKEKGYVMELKKKITKIDARITNNKWEFFFW